MLCIITMRKVKAGNVHAILCQPQHNILVIGIGTHGTDDLCLFHFVNNAKRSLRRMMGGSIIDIVCGLQILGVVTYLLSPEFFGYLILNPALVVRGQIWRIVTFLAYPPAVTGGDAISFVIFNAIGIYCVRLFGLLVEQVWGRFKFNCYIISGVLLHAAVSVLIYLITGMPLTKE